MTTRTRETTVGGEEEEEGEETRRLQHPHRLSAPQPREPRVFFVSFLS